MFKNILKQLIKSRNSALPATSPIAVAKAVAKRKFLLGQTKHALDLYVKKCDVNRFTELALSNPEDKSHNDIMEKLFSEKNIIDPLSDENISSLIGNNDFLKDLGLDK